MVAKRAPFEGRLVITGLSSMPGAKLELPTSCRLTSRSSKVRSLAKTSRRSVVGGSRGTTCTRPSKSVLPSVGAVSWRGPLAVSTVTFAPGSAETTLGAETELTCVRELGMRDGATSSTADVPLPRENLRPKSSAPGGLGNWAKRKSYGLAVSFPPARPRLATTSRLASSKV